VVGAHQRARARGARLFYLASFDGITPRVGLMSLPATIRSPAAAPAQRGVFRTDRYFDQPLTISGPARPGRHCHRRSSRRHRSGAQLAGKGKPNPRT